MRYRFNTPLKLYSVLQKSQSPFQAKIEAQKLMYNPHWIDQKEKAMEEVLSAKAASCPEVRNALTCSESVLAEVVLGDPIWSTGLRNSA